MAWLLYASLVYVAACYLGGLYLVLRLASGRRLRQVLARGPRRRCAAGLHTANTTMPVEGEGTAATSTAGPDLAATSRRAA